MRLRTSFHPYWVFADSSGYYASAVRRDDNYQPAQAILVALAAERVHFYTTTYVLAETHALFVKRQRDARGAFVFLTRLEQASGTTIITPTTADAARARAILAEYQDHLFTLTDALSFAVMERLGISRVFSFDHDFEEYGFSPLTP